MLRECVRGVRRVQFWGIVASFVKGVVTSLNHTPHDVINPHFDV